jgi:hypothetical protein
MHDKAIIHGLTLALALSLPLGGPCGFSKEVDLYKLF